MSMDRVRWDRARAAWEGDEAAFGDICNDLRDHCERIVLRALAEGSETASSADVTSIVDAACHTAFEERADRPPNWSHYSWITWVARREAIIWSMRQEH